MDVNWLTEQHQYIVRWQAQRQRVVISRPLQAPLHRNSEYMSWYWRITRRWMSRTAAASLATSLGYQSVYRATLQSSQTLQSTMLGDIGSFSADMLRALGEDHLLQPDPHVHKAPQTRSVEVPGGESGQDRWRPGGYTWFGLWLGSGSSGFSQFQSPPSAQIQVGFTRRQESDEEGNQGDPPPKRDRPQRDRRPT